MCSRESITQCVASYVGYTHHLSPAFGCALKRTRYATWSHRFGLSLSQSCLKRSTASFSPNLPFRMSSKSRRFSSTGRSRYGHATDGTAPQSTALPSASSARARLRACAASRSASISSLLWWHTYALPLRISDTAMSYSASKCCDVYVTFSGVQPIHVRSSYRLCTYSWLSASGFVSS